MNKEEKYNIPKEFMSAETNDYFQHCIECDRPLLNEETDYFIEKCIRTYPDFTATDTVFEYAICISCAEKMRAKLSKESLEAIENFMKHKVDPFRHQAFISNHPEPENWTGQCLVSGRSKTDVEEYQVYAHCRGTSLVHGMQMPYMISGEVLDQVSQLLSNETLDELDNFMNDNFGPPPELEELLPRRKVVLI